MQPTMKTALMAFAATSLASGAWAQTLPGAMIDIGGHRVHLVCSGEGERTILLDAGAGGWSFTWLSTQTQLASVGFRVCAWDRLGVGLSDVGPLPRTSASIVQEMKALIDAAQLDTPLILVGHSFGGQNVRMFAATYPETVAGVVLVDSGHDDGFAVGLPEGANGEEVGVAVEFELGTIGAPIFGPYGPRHEIAWRQSEIFEV